MAIHLNRNIVTPLVAGAFLLSAVTGTLLFFHLDSGVNKAVHEWLSWALLLGAGLHLATNFPALKRHLTGWRGRSIVGLFALILALSFIPFGGKEGSEPPFLGPIHALAQTPLSTLAQVAKVTPETLHQRLSQMGVQIHSDQQSLEEVIGNDTRRQMQVLGQVMQMQ